jgi:hypothetical protein
MTASATLTSSKLLFIDSDNSSINGTGDEFSINLPNHGLSVNPNQFLRMTLIDLHMYKNFYNINATNNHLVISNNGVGEESITITPKNYEFYFDIVDDLADQLLASTLFTGFTKGAILPASAEGTTNTGDRKLSITLSKVAHGITPIIQCRDYGDQQDRGDFIRDHNDSYALLGAKRITAPNTTAQSFNITVNADDVVITGYFPMQRSTMEHVYLRTDLVSDNYGSKHFDSSRTDHNIDMVGTDILGMIPVDNEFVSYKDGGSGLYFADIFRQNLTQIKLRITDSKHRTIPIVNTDHHTLGNFNFTVCIKADIFSYPAQNITESKPHERFNNISGVITQKEGRRRIPF